MLGSVSHKWFKICIQLGIPHNTLKQFEKEDCPLSSAIDYWLHGNVVDPEIPVSWKSIVAALKAETVEETGLADKINAMFCQKEGKVDERG